MSEPGKFVAVWLLCVVALSATRGAIAEPHFAVQQGLKCGSCHVNPTGGGLRSVFGNLFIRNDLAGRVVGNDEQTWTGQVSSFLAIGGDLRWNASATEVPNQDTTDEFDVQEGRLYLDLSAVPNRVSIYFDQRLAPGASENLEAYVRYTTADANWYVKAGRFFLPYGLRIEDDSAFSRTVPGINMATSDEGIELGYEHAAWSAQVALSNGTAGGPELDKGKQATAMLQYVQPRWRLGGSASYNHTDAGDRSLGNLFAGLRTGPISWLAEADYIRDEAFPEGTRVLWAGYLEASARLSKGHHLRTIAEFADPDDDVEEDEQARYSLIYEYWPIQYLQLRAGFQYYDGIPQNNLQNRRVLYVQVHGVF